LSAPIIPGGCILLSRKIIESQIWRKPPLYLKVWIYLLSKAQHSPYKKLKRGQLVTSIPDIIEDCSWQVGYRKEKPTKDQIYQIIEWLRKVSETPSESNNKTTMIATTKATQGMLITIVNYDIYQTLKNYESNDEGNNETSTGATSEQRQPNNTNKNDNNVFEEEEELSSTKEDERSPLEAVISHYRNKACIISESSNDVQSAMQMLAKIPLDTIIRGIDNAFMNFKPKFEGDKINSLKYCEGAVKKLYQSEKTKEVKSGGGYRSGNDAANSEDNSSEQVPGWRASEEYT
jgi:hypothetical protein